MAVATQAPATSVPRAAAKPKKTHWWNTNSVVDQPTWKNSPKKVGVDSPAKKAAKRTNNKEVPWYNRFTVSSQTPWKQSTHKKNGAVHADATVKTVKKQSPTKRNDNINEVGDMSPYKLVNNPAKRLPSMYEDPTFV